MQKNTGRAARLNTRSTPKLLTPRLKPKLKQGLLAASMLFALSAYAQGEKLSINLPAAPLDKSINELARQAGVQIIFASGVASAKTAPAIKGEYTTSEALDKLLTGTGLKIQSQGDKTFTIVPTPARLNTLPEVSVSADAEKESATSPVHGYLAKRSATGTKTDASILETPQSISVVTADRIKAMGATNVREVLAYTPGIDIAPYGSESRYDSWITIRGFDSYSPGYYMDSLPLRNNGGFGLWQTENYNTERIEILRGPASVLYGQNPPGGMVNIVSKRPTTDPLRELQVQVGDHARKQIAGDFSGPVDKEGKVLYRVTGLVRDAEMQGSGAPNDRTFLAPSLTFKPSSDTTLTVMAQYLRVNSGISYRSLPIQGTLQQNPNGRIAGSTYLGEPGFDKQTQEQWLAGYTLEHKINGMWTVRQNTRYGKLDGNIQQIWQGTAFRTLSALDSTDPTNFRSVDRYVFQSRDKVSSFTVDNQVQADINLGQFKHKVLLGLDYQNSRFDQVSSFGGDAGSIDVYAPVYGAAITLPNAPYQDTYSKLRQTGVYVQDQIRIDNWVATVGGRYDRAGNTIEDRIGDTATQLSDSKFTKRGGLVYLADNGIAPYVSYAESFTPTATVSPDPSQPFKPETGRQYELGARYQPPGRKDLYSAAIFDLRRQNYITTEPNTFVPRQTGEVVVRGLELEAILQPLPRMNLTAAYAWTPKADVTASVRPAEIGKQLVPVSRNRLSVWADYRLPIGIKFGVGARYTGSNMGYNGNAPAEVPDYTVYDAMLGYDLHQWEFLLNARNLTNKTYIANCAVDACYYGDQRKVLATLTYRW